ncbi:MAG: branched-chain amino acid aminotransferase [Betaproteobacteria bacterium]
MSDFPIRIQPHTPPAPSLPQELGFGRTFTSRMFTQHYSVDRGWHDAAIVPYGPLALDPAAQLFHCGQIIFEGMKGLRRPDGQVNLFRAADHLERFNRSAKRMAMPSIDVEAHLHAVQMLMDLERDWIPDRPGASLYCRPVMMANDRSLEVRASHSYLHFIILSPISAYFGDDAKPVSVFVSDEHFRAVRGGTGEAKTVANYAVSLYASELARSHGYDQVLWLDAVERRYVEEAGAMSVAFVYGGEEIRTPALSGSILASVTRESLLQLAPDLGYEVTEDRIAVDEVLRDIERGDITEAFCLGTAAVVASIGRVGFYGRDYILNDMQPGPVAKHLYRALTDIQFGRSADPYGWTTLLPSFAEALTPTAIVR